MISSVGRCGIAEHSRMLINSLPEVAFHLDPAWLDPQAFAAVNPIEQRYDVVHLNYHRGLHSRWTPEVLRTFPDLRFVITFHDTYEVQPDGLAWDLLACPNVRGMVVHEPCDLWDEYELKLGGVLPAHYGENRHKVHYWRQPCPDPLGRGSVASSPLFAKDTWRPTLGTLGFDFPWKNYDLLARATGELGWNLLILGEVTPERRNALAALNKRTFFEGYEPETWQAVAKLAACDATAFLYTCANSGTSGAIRVGMTAGKPLVAAKGCRQFRDLEGAKDGWPITWIEPTEQGLHRLLTGLSMPHFTQMPQGFHLGLIALAHANSWEKIGPKYAVLYRQAAQA